MIRTDKNTLYAEISREIATRISRNLVKRLGTPEGSNWSRNGAWFTETTFRFRLDDGSAWARLGMGPTRRMVTMQHNDKSETVRLWVYTVRNA
jgi:hypothetical protein